jgi:acetyl esterase
MEFARGVKEVLLYEAGFDNPVDAAEFWSDAGVYVEYEDMTYPGGEGQDQRLRLYRGGEADRPTLLYIHGGGWVGGSIELHDYSARGMAFEARCNVVSISYRLAPVYRFPSGLDDCLAATTWIEQMGASLGINPECIVIGGASAGGNLAAAAALASDQFRYSGLLVFYGVLGCDFETDSYLRYTHGPGLTKARMKELFSLYLGDMHQAQDPLVSPLLSTELEKLPRTYVIAAEHDVLLEENRSFVAALKAASVPVGFHIEPGVTHGFINRGRLVPSADTSISIAANFLASFAQTENL